jgi:hypothetical protein
LIQNFTLAFNPINNIAVTGFSFTANSNANLNGSNDNDNANCSTITTACPVAIPVLSSVANAPGSAPLRSLSDFSFIGPASGNTFSNSAAEITQAELVNATPTSTKQISEVEIAGTGVGDANTNVGSQTQFVFSFTTGQTTDLTLAFEADPRLFVKVDTPSLIAALAGTTISSSFELSGDNGVSVSWKPDGKTATDQSFNFSNCAGATCVENADQENLNVTISLPPGNPSSNAYSAADGFSNFGISITGLPAGKYTLGLGATTFSTSEQKLVPEPGILALLGIGLAGLGVARRRISV